MMIKFFKKDEKKLIAEAWIKQQLDVQYAMISKLLDRLLILERRVEEIFEIVKGIKDSMKEEKRTLSLSARTKEAIKLILKKQGRLTASSLAKLINLSRTRCNEYLKEMEREGTVKSEISKRKKFYFLP